MRQNRELPAHSLDETKIKDFFKKLRVEGTRNF